MTKILFVHRHFPGQFKHLAATMARSGAYEVAALHGRPGMPAMLEGVTLHEYVPARGSAEGVHPWVGHFESQVILGEAAYRKAVTLRAGGYMPDAIIGHPDWGELMFLRDAWPEARLGLYCELYGRPTQSHWDFDPEFAQAHRDAALITRIMNVPVELSFAQAAGGLSPTHWQADGFPAHMRPRITVAHDGIDTQRLVPHPGVTIQPRPGLALTRRDEVVTFVSRTLEPYRGFHRFLRALPELLRKRPRAHVIIVGRDREGYGSPPPEGTWRALYEAELNASLPAEARACVHFVGTVPYDAFVAILQLSTVHVYLTVPYVLSWSLLEAMSAGCAIVASDTAPVREVVTHEKTGLMVDFFDTGALAGAIDRLLGDAPLRARLGTAARAHAVGNYDVRSCVPAQARWVAGIALG
ncbi:glycosyltransferase [Aureimonas frigidaquae]|uniref:glycosyltransferase n=1 Tax=Aureimonas frigidaquae TaxID=424757 RepID=UPI000781AC94|nr:glycosyltransferase [Aureimonas frigidaquae]